MRKCALVFLAGGNCTSGGGDPPCVSSGIVSCGAVAVCAGPRLRGGLLLTALERPAVVCRLAAGRRLALVRCLVAVRRLAVVRSSLREQFCRLFPCKCKRSAEVGYGQAIEPRTFEPIHATAREITSGNNDQSDSWGKPF